MSGPTSTHIFCGIGGDTKGFELAGFAPVIAANHNPVAVASHKINFPHIRHVTADMNNYDMRRLPSTDVLFASPVCTESSPAGGRRRTRGQLTLPADKTSVPDATWERTRATAYDVLRATEVHRYLAVACENVLEFVTDWELFDWWLQGMRLLGYNHQVVSVNAAHVAATGSQTAPQWRNRILLAFTRKDLPEPDLTVTVPAVCPECGPVRARQEWRNPFRRRIGKWGDQYDYRCPTPACRGRILTPQVRPIGEVVDWSLPGQRIGDGKPRHRTFTPYAASTRAKVAIGLEKYGHEPFVAMLRRNCTVTPLGEPILTVMAQGRHHALVVPNGRRAAVKTTDEPLSTVTTKPQHSLVRPAATVDDCTIRMFTPAELARSQAFPPGYEMTGTETEKYIQVGNAVPVNLAHWLGERIRAVLS